jgi:hypothetical protein
MMNSRPREISPLASVDDLACPTQFLACEELHELADRLEAIADHVRALANVARLAKDPDRDSRLGSCYAEIPHEGLSRK